MLQTTTEAIIVQLGFREEIQQLREIVETWIRDASPEISAASRVAVYHQVEDFQAADGVQRSSSDE